MYRLPARLTRRLAVSPVMIGDMRVPRAPLPDAWETALGGWATWLRIAGRREATIRLRCDHLRAIARRSATDHPADVTATALVRLCSQSRWSNEYRKGMRCSLVSFFEWAITEQITTDNPALLLPKVSPTTPRPRPATDDMWEQLLEVAPPRERIMVLLAGEAGLRRGEVAAVHRNDLIHDGAGWSLLVHGKGGRQRVVPVTDWLAGEIRAHAPGGGYLFPNSSGGHITPGYVGTLISRLMPDGWSMHKLRHRFASRGYAGTGNLRAVQEALGHASVATTQRYTAVSSKDVRSVSEAARWIINGNRKEPHANTDSGHGDGDSSGVVVRRPSAG